MSFFIKKMSQKVWATIMPFGPVTLISYRPKQIFSGRPKAGPHFKHCLRISILMYMYTLTCKRI